MLSKRFPFGSCVAQMAEQRGQSLFLSEKRETDDSKHAAQFKFEARIKSYKVWD